MGARNRNQLIQFSMDFPDIWARFMDFYEDPSYLSGGCNRCGSTVEDHMIDYHNSYHMSMSLTIWLLTNGRNDLLMVKEKLNDRPDDPSGSGGE